MSKRGDDDEASVESPRAMMAAGELTSVPPSSGLSESFIPQNNGFARRHNSKSARQTPQNKSNTESKSNSKAVSSQLSRNQIENANVISSWRRNKSQRGLDKQHNTDKK